MVKKVKKFFILPLLTLIFVSGMAINSKSTVADETVKSTDLNSRQVTEIDVEELMNQMFNEKFEDLGLPSVDDEVWAIVELNSSSLLEAAKAEKYKGSLNQYLSTASAAAQLQVIEAEQEVIKNRISEKLDVEFKYSYTTITNGFAVKLKFGDYEKLKKINGVKQTILSVEYYLPEEEQAQDYVTNLATLAGAKSTSSVYRGQGMVIGILDTGLQTGHEAFTVVPSMQRLTASSVEDVLADTVANIFSYQKNKTYLSASDVYVSGKIPFAYDYADMDTNVNPNLKTMESNGNDHGSHVAGIAAGNNGKDFEGAAPEAQLAIFKVFSDSNQGAKSIDIIAALNDAVVLGVDVVNMSLGSACGFSVDSDGKSYQKFYEALYENGISLVTSAGNQYMAGLGTNYTYGTIDTPDQATISSPASYPNSFSVASFDTENEKSAAIVLGGIPCIYNDAVINQTTSEKTDFVKLLAGDQEKVEYEYVDCGTGTVDEIAQVDLKGKIALIKRGDLSFAEKAGNAEAAGAVGVVIYNNVAGARFNAVVEGVTIPVCSISLEDGLKAAAAKNKILEVGSGVYIYGGTMSLFSSWGPTPDLHIKPEITSYGGSVYSVLPNETLDGYQLMSGTSMSSPNMAGNVALVRQYLADRFSNYGITSNEIYSQAQQLLMSTATPVVNRDNNVYYSPRRQGAGLVNIDNALKTPAYLYVKGSSGTKIELGDDPKRNGDYELTFVLTNMSTSKLSYKINPVVLTTSVSTTDNYTLEGVSKEITDSKYSYSVSGNGSLSGDTVTVDALKEVVITVNVKLSDSTKASLNDTYNVGTYVEGFVKLDPTTDNEVELSVPYLAYYGDWDEAAIFDTTEYDSDAAVAYAAKLVGLYYGGQYLMQLGTYKYKTADGVAVPSISQSHNSISPINQYAIYNLYAVYTGLLRNAAKITYEIYDANTNELLESYYANYVRKAHYSFISNAYAPSGVGLNLSLNYANNTHLKFVVTAYTDTSNPYQNSNFQYEFDLYIDYEAPKIIGIDQTAEDVANGKEASGGFKLTEENGRKYLEFDVYDNHALQAYTLYDSEQNALELPVPFYSNLGETVHVKHDITEYVDSLTDNQMIVMVSDYALNTIGYIITLPLHEVTDAKFEKDEYTVAINESLELGVIINPEEGYIVSDSVKWTSSNPAVVKVEDGIITGVSAGEANVTLTFKTINDKEISCSTKVIVTENEVEVVEVEAVELSETTKTVVAGEQFKLEATITPWNATDKTLTWKSSDEKVAVVDENGNVTTISSGTTTITVTAKNGKSASCKVTVRENSGDFTIVAGVLTAYTGNGGALIIPEGVVSIADKVFQNKKNITSVQLPTTLKSVGAYAFSGATNLTSVIFTGTSEYKINKYAFDGCTALSSVTLSDNLVEIGNYAFQKCTSLTSFDMPDTVTTLGPGAFIECKNLADVKYSSSLTTVPNTAFRETALTKFTVTSNITSIGDSAFYGATKLVDFVIENRDSNLKFGNYALFKTAIKEVLWGDLDVTISSSIFAQCTSLVKVVLPETVTEVPNAAFQGCSLLKDITFKGGYTKIGNSGFAGTAYTEFEVPETVESISNSAFSNMPNLKKLVINCYLPKIVLGLCANDAALEEIVLQPGYTDIFSTAFQGCSSLKSFVVAEGCLTIGNQAFSDCTSLEEVTLPSTFKTGNNNMFKNCTSLKKVYLKSKEAVNWQAGQTVTYKAFAGVDSVEIIASADSYFASSNDGIIYSADYKQIEYVFDNPTAYVDGFYTMRSEVESIVKRAFMGQKMTGMALSENLKEIGDYAFNSAAITELNVPASLEVIGAFAFQSCKALTTLTFAENSNLTTIKRAAFYSCGITEVNLPDSLITIEDGKGTKEGAFSLNPITKVTFGKNLEHIGNYSFCNDSVTKWTTTIREVDLSNTKVKTIGKYAFKNAPLSKLELPECLETIGDYAFYSGGYDEIEQQHNVTLEHINFPEGLTSIGKYAFMGWCYLREINMPDTLVELGESAFRICVSVEKIHISTSLTELKSYAFGYLGWRYQQYNPNWETYTPITKIYIPANITKMDINIFNNSPSIEYVEIDPANPVFRSEAGIVYDNNNQLIYCPANLGAMETFTIPSFIKTISGDLLSSTGFNNIKAKTLIIPSTVQKISQSAFARCKFEEVIFEGNYNLVLESNVFASSAKLKRVVLPEGLVTIPQNLFNGCANLTEVVWPSTLRNIDTGAFTGTGLSGEIELPSTVKVISYMAFANCDKITKVILPEELEAIYGFTAHVTARTYQIFDGCTALESFEISENNNYFTTVDGVLYLKDGKTLYAYPQGKKDETFRIKEGVEVIKMYAFKDNTSLKEVVLPSTLTTVGSAAFYGCTSLTKVTFLSTKAPVLEETDYSISKSTITISGYANFVKPIYTYESWTEEINGLNYVYSKIYYTPVQGLTMVTPTDSKGYDAWNYSMIFEKTEKFTTDEILATSDLAVETQEKGNVVSWKGSDLGATYEVYRSFANGSFKLVGTTKDCYFVDEDALAVTGTYTYKVIAKVKGVTFTFTSNELLVDATRKATDDQAYIVDMANQIVELCSKADASKRAEIVQLYQDYLALSKEEAKMLGYGELLETAYSYIEQANQYDKSVRNCAKSANYLTALSQIGQFKANYGLLKANAKVYVTAYDDLLAWEQEVQEARTFIRALYGFGQVTEASGDKINELNEQYASFNAYQLELVTPSYKEQMATIQAKYLALVKDIAQRNVKIVCDLIENLSSAPIQADALSVKTARDAYDALNDAEKSMVPAELVTKLETVEAVLAENQANGGCSVNLGTIFVSSLSALSLAVLVLKKKQF